MKQTLANAFVFYGLNKVEAVSTTYVDRSLVHEKLLNAIMMLIPGC